MLSSGLSLDAPAGLTGLLMATLPSISLGKATEPGLIPRPCLRSARGRLLTAVPGRWMTGRSVEAATGVAGIDRAPVLVACGDKAAAAGGGKEPALRSSS